VLKCATNDGDFGDRPSGAIEQHICRGLTFSVHVAFDIAGTDLNIANNRMAFLTMISYTDFDDLRMGKKGAGTFLRNYYVKTLSGKDTIAKNPHPLLQKFSGYRQWNLTQKFKYVFKANSSLDVGFYYSSTGDVPRYDRLTQEKNGRLKYATWYYHPQNWMMANAKIKWHNARRLYDHANLTMAWQQINEGRNDRKFGNSLLRKRTEKVNIASLNADFDKKVSENNSFYAIQLGVFSKTSKQNFQVEVKEMVINGKYYCFYGQYYSIDEARSELEKMKNMGFKDAFITGFDQGKKVGPSVVKNNLESL